MSIRQLTLVGLVVSLLAGPALAVDFDGTGGGGAAPESAILAAAKEISRNGAAVQQGRTLASNDVSEDDSEPWTQRKLREIDEQGPSVVEKMTRLERKTMRSYVEKSLDDIDSGKALKDMKAQLDMDLADAVNGGALSSEDATSMKQDLLSHREAALKQRGVRLENALRILKAAGSH